MPCRPDRNCNGGVMIYIRKDIPTKILEKHELPHDIEGVFIELNFRRVKWLLFGTYHLPSKNYQYYFEALDNALDSFSSYDRIVSADFNTDEKETCMKTFLHQNDFKNLVKNSSKPTTINLFLTSESTCFQKTKTVFTVFIGLSD